MTQRKEPLRVGYLLAAEVEAVDKLCPLLQEPCIQGRCAFWISVETGLVRPVEEAPGIDVGLHVATCAIPLAASLLLGAEVRRKAQ
jgi:hypothetical protein